MDPSARVQGPFPRGQFGYWLANGDVPPNLPVRAHEQRGRSDADHPFFPLTDMLTFWCHNQVAGREVSEKGDEVVADAKPQERADASDD
ncbi:hypothetical protein GPECTOR_40g512 [Gonium pectorale]|uniref:GYF domain-containing protein n=1 Tax=Gonium pectorale TaxID=33097 RepID=A0A150GAC9_GONPE|nr:hypothetical protein GPECTOR_40g512 [Gonium pectorale]|eukprot:KXZ46778.1 hypothetical protein GPECTOR_40g512 [Gonium pectorale]